MELENLTKDQLEKLQVEKEQEYQEIINALTQVELEEIEIAKQILQLQLKRKELQSAIKKATHRVKVLSSELRNIKVLIYQRLRGE